MVQVSERNSVNSDFTSILNQSLFHTLIIIFLCVFFVWYAQYRWKRRKLYEAAAQLNGPLALPLLGSVLFYYGSIENVLGKIANIFHKFNAPIPLWFGPELAFMICGRKDIETIMHSPHALAKSDMYKFLKSEVGAGLFIAPLTKWKRIRKIVAPAFNQKLFNEFAVTFSEKSEILVEILQKQVGKGMFDVFPYVSRCMTDIVCEFALGTTVNAQTTDSVFVKALEKGMELICQRLINIFYHPDFVFKRSSLAKELYNSEKIVHDFTSSIVLEERKAYQRKLTEIGEGSEAQCTKESRTTFLQQLLEIEGKGANITSEEIYKETNALLVAGSHPTATTSSFIFVMLGMFPEIQDRVYNEVIDVIGFDRLVELSDLGKLQYLERVIKETLRIFPAGLILGRSVTEDIKLEKCTVPAGCTVLLGIIIMHRDPKLWPEPLKFDPDRFLPEEVSKRHPYSYLPFSGGPRNCLGPKFAMMTMKTLIATTIRKYRFFTDYKSPEDIKIKPDMFLKPADGYKVSIKLR